MGTGINPGSFSRVVPADDNRARLVCDVCGFIQYENPKIVVGALCRWRDRILLCRRAIPPRAGYWTLPAGYLELNETSEAGARREVWEEARARITIDRLMAIYDIPRISQVQLFYRARLLASDIAPGPESREVALFSWEEIPRDALAFPSVAWALDQDREIGAASDFAVRTNPPGETGDVKPGSGGSCLSS